MSPRRGRNSKVAEYYGSLLCRLPWSGSGAQDPIRTLGVTSCHSGEGVSTVALQLASTAASYAHQRVLLVDCNLARASAAHRLRLASPTGLSEAMANGRGPDTFVQRCQIQNLSVLAAGQTNGRQPGIYNINDLRRVIDGLKENYDLLVFDVPPSGEGGVGVVLARLMDGVLVVVEAERVRREVVQRTIEDLQRANVNVLGVVLNKRR